MGMLANFIIASDDIFENGKILENWTLGERHIINKKQTVDMRGYYTFASEEMTNKKISIVGGLTKPTTFFYELDSAIINTKISDKNINISDNDGNFRAIGKFNNGMITGRYQNKHGEYYDFKMVRDSLFFSLKKLGDHLIYPRNNFKSN